MSLSFRSTIRHLAAAQNFSDARPSPQQVAWQSPEVGHRVRLAQAQAVGRMKTDRFAPVTASRMRPDILSGSDPVRIREFKLFNTDRAGTTR